MKHQNNSIMQKYTEFVNSKDRTATSTSSSDFTIKLSRTYNDVKSVRLVAYQMSNTLYTINSSNDKLIWMEKEGIDPWELCVASLTHKNYTASQLATEIQSKMIGSSYYLKTYTVTYDPQTLKYTTTMVAPLLGDSFYFYFSHDTNSCAVEMGYDKTYVGNMNTSDVSTNVVRLDKGVILMETDILNNIHGGNVGLGTCSYLLQMPPNGETQFYYTEVVDHMLCGTFTFNQIKIKLKDFDNKIVELNGSNNIFVFEFIC
jgi:hypothetical protein